MSEKTIVIVECLVAIGLTIVYFKICSDRKMSTSAKIVELIGLYGLNILAFTGRIKFWIALIGIAAIGLIKVLTTKKQSIERKHTGVDI